MIGPRSLIGFSPFPPRQTQGIPRTRKEEPGGRLVQLAVSGRTKEEGWFRNELIALGQETVKDTSNAAKRRRKARRK